MLVIAARKKVVRNAETSETGENGENSKNEEKNENLQINLI